MDEDVTVIDTEEDHEEVVSVAYEARVADHVDTAVVEYRDAHGDLHEREVAVHVYDGGSGHPDTAVADLHGGGYEVVVAQDVDGDGRFDHLDTGGGQLVQAPAPEMNESRVADPETVVIDTEHDHDAGWHHDDVHHDDAPAHHDDAPAHHDDAPAHHDDDGS